MSVCSSSSSSSSSSSLPQRTEVEYFLSKEQEAKKERIKSIVYGKNGVWKLRRRVRSRADVGLVVEALVGAKAGAGPYGLDLSKNGLSDDAVADLVVGLEGAGSVERLNLGWNKIRKRGLSALGKWLESRAGGVLEALDLRGNALPPRECVRFLARITNFNTTLTSLSLARVELATAAGAALAELVASSAALTTLDVGNCNLSASGCAHLAVGVQGSRSLAHLNMEGNRAGPGTAQALSPALADPECPLLFLNLNCNALSPAGGVLLAPGLGANTSLSHLGLGWNGLATDGGLALAEALSPSSRLCVLDLRDNKFGYEVGTALLPVLHALKATLVTVDLSGNEFGDVAHANDHRVSDGSEPKGTTYERPSRSSC